MWCASNGVNEMNYINITFKYVTYINFNMQYNL